MTGRIDFKASLASDVPNGVLDYGSNPSWCPKWEGCQDSVRESSRLCSALNQTEFP
jgi:hypothetical protein